MLAKLRLVLPLSLAGLSLYFALFHSRHHRNNVRRKRNLSTAENFFCATVGNGDTVHEFSNKQVAYIELATH